MKDYRGQVKTVLEVTKEDTDSLIKSAKLIKSILDDSLELIKYEKNDKKAENKTENDRLEERMQLFKEKNPDAPAEIISGVRKARGDYNKFIQNMAEINIYPFVRCPSGAKVGQKFVYSEEQLNKMLIADELETGDLVEVLESQRKNNHPEIIRIASKNYKKYRPIIERHLLFVHKDEHGLYVKQDEDDPENIIVFNSDGSDKVYLNAKDIKKYHIDEDSIVNYAFYGNQVFSGRVRRAYKSLSLEEVSKKRKEFKKKKHGSFDYQAKLDFTLKDKKVAVITNGRNHLEKVANSHDALVSDQLNFEFNGSNEREILKEINQKDYDYVVLCIDKSSHSLMNKVRDFCKEKGIQFAISNSSNGITVEKAFYRCVNNLSSYDGIESNVYYKRLVQA